jgi:hypothetical protein
VVAGSKAKNGDNNARLADVVQQVGLSGANEKCYFICRE